MSVIKELKNAKRGRGRKTSRRSKVKADWSKVNAEALYYLILIVIRFDGAVRFGCSRDGCQYSIGVYGDGEPWTEYLDGSKDVSEWLGEIIADYEKSDGAITATVSD